MIRLAVAADAPAIGELLQHTIKGAESADIHWISERINSPTGLVLVDHVNESIRGFILGQVVIDEAEIHDVGVEPTNQRKGIGFKLISSFEKHAARRGATTCVLEVRSHNIAARGAYLKAGYAEIGHRDGYYADGENALLMRHDFQGAS